MNCPECHSEIEGEEEDFAEGECLDCDGCGATLVVTQTDPVVFEAEEEEEPDFLDYDDGDDEFDDDEEDDEGPETEDWV